MMKTAKLLVIVSAIFILAAFFLPWLSVSINNQNVLNRSGLDLAQGHYGLSEIINSKYAVSYDGFMTEQLLQDIMNESVGTMIDVLGLSVAEASLYLVPAFAVILIILSLSWRCIASSKTEQKQRAETFGHERLTARIGGVSVLSTRRCSTIREDQSVPMLSGEM